MQKRQIAKNILLAAGLFLLFLLAFMMFKKPELSAEDVVIGHIDRTPILSLDTSSWGKTRFHFIMYEGKQAIWHSDRSPTGFLIAQLSTKEQQELTDLAKKITWGKHYKLSSGFDFPTSTIHFQGQATSVYGGLPNTSNLLGIAVLYLEAASSDANPKTGINNAVSLPSQLLQLYNRLTDFDLAKAKPWLPNYISLSIKSIEPEIDHDTENCPSANKLVPLPAGLPAVSSEDISACDQTLVNQSLCYRTYLSEEEKKHIRQRFANGVEIHYTRRLDSNEYKKQIVELLKISRHSDIFNGFNLNQPVSMVGQACRFSLNVDDQLTEELLDPKLFEIMTREARKQKTKTNGNPRKESNQQNGTPHCLFSRG